MSIPTPRDVFEDADKEVHKFRYSGRIYVPMMCGGTPTDPRIAENWIKTKLGITSEEQIRERVTQIMDDHDLTLEEGAQIAHEMKNLNRFKRTPEGQLYLEARCLKANLKEAVSVCVAAKTLKARGWGETKKWVTNFFPEHVFVLENKLLLEDTDGNPVTKESEVNQRFIATRFGSGIKYEERVDDVFFDFTVVGDYYFTDSQWEAIWATGKRLGLGASRSQGYGVYSVVKWDMID